jgi:hypothetical protein
MAMLENLLSNLKSSQSTTSQNLTQTCSRREAFTFTESDRLTDSQMGSVMTDHVTGAQLSSRSDGQFVQPPDLPPEPPGQFSPLLRVFSLPNLDQVDSSRHSTVDDVLQLSTSLSESRPEPLHVDSSCMDVSAMSDDEERGITTCERTGLPAANLFHAQKPSVAANVTCTSDEGEEGSCIYSGETVCISSDSKF